MTLNETRKFIVEKVHLPNQSERNLIAFAKELDLEINYTKKGKATISIIVDGKIIIDNLRFKKDSIRERIKIR